MSKDTKERQGPDAGGVSRRRLLEGLALGAVTTAQAGPASLPALAQPTPRKAGRPYRKLLLGAGGIKGAFQAGAIRRTLELGFRPDVIYGVSAGSLNGAFLADRAFFLGKPRKQYFDATGSKAPGGMDLGAPVDWPFIGAELTRFWTDKVTGPKSLARRRSFRAALALMLRSFDGLYDNEPLRKLVHATIDRQRVRNSGIPFGVVATNIDTGQAEYHFDGQDGVDIRDAVVASSAMPVAFPLAKLAGTFGVKQYCDGAMREIVPITLAIKPGVPRPPTHLVAIVCQPPRSVLGRLDQPGNIIHLMQRQIDIVAEELIQNDLRALEGSGIRHIAIRPDVVINRDDKTRRIYEIDNFEAHHISEMIHRGAFYAKHVLGLPQSRFVEDGFRDA